MVAVWVDQYMLDFQIYLCEMELDVTVPAKPIFYKGYVDDTYVRKKEYHIDKLFEKLNP